MWQSVLSPLFDHVVCLPLYRLLYHFINVGLSVRHSVLSVSLVSGLSSLLLKMHKLVIHKNSLLIVNFMLSFTECPSISVLLKIDSECH